MGKTLMSDDVQGAAEGFWARINHPVIGVFITSAIGWNWEIFYYIIRGLETPQETIDLIHKQYLNPGNWVNLLFIPLLITISFLSCAPWLHEVYARYKEWVRAKTMKVGPKFQFEFDDLKLKFDNEIKQKQDQINGLANTVSHERNISKDKIESIQKELDLYKESERLKGNRNTYIEGLGHIDVFGILQQRKQLDAQLISKDKIIDDLSKEVSKLKLEKADLVVLIDQEKHKK
jgi:hypothetical protein